jgi:hypothetical protein
MSKSRRQRAYTRKLDAIRQRADELLAEWAPKRAEYEPTRTLVYEQKASEYLKSVFTPEYMESWNASLKQTESTHHAISTLSGRLQAQLQQHRPSYGLGSYRTKRLRKKMYTWWEKELRARGL